MNVFLFYVCFTFLLQNFHLVMKSVVILYQMVKTGIAEANLHAVFLSNTSFLNISENGSVALYICLHFHLLQECYPLIPIKPFHSGESYKDFFPKSRTHNHHKRIGANLIVSDNNSELIQSG